mgnify:FL=1
MLNHLHRLLPWCWGKRAREPWSLDNPLLHLSRQDVWTLRDAVAGCLILGESGGGKTSGSGQTIAESFLDAGMGGLVCAAKTEEIATWQKYCARTGRTKDLILFSPDRSLRYNFLDDELHSSAGHAGGATLNVVAMLLSVLEVVNRIGSGGNAGRGESGGDGDPYWKNSARQLISQTVDLLVMSRDRVRMLDIQRIIASIPQTADQVRDPDWQRESLCYRCIMEADALTMPDERREDLEMIVAYFLDELAKLSPKTRGVIVSCVGAMTDTLLRGMCRTLFCTNTNITPALCGEGKIIVVAIPVKEFRESGLIANMIWKTGFQRWAERRDVAANPRPVFQWLDEAPNFISSGDQVFQASCRSSRVATVMLGQNISGFYSALGGGDKGKAESDSLFGNLATKAFHSSSDPVTNRWASELIGDRVRLLMNGNSSRPEPMWSSAALGSQESGNSSAGFSESVLPMVTPAEFISLRSGGPANKGCVDAIIVKSGTGFNSTGRNWMKCTFSQVPSDRR